MRRRAFLAGCAGCLAMSALRAQEPWQMPARFARPDTASDEGGLWAMMDREEAKLRRSPFALRDPQLRAYVQDITCRLAGEHCPDVRVHLVRSPFFNASMAPNGMMQVWTGLMLRVDNEAQLAAVLGHEIGHFLQRHSLERLRDARTRSAFGQFLGLFGVAGAVGQVGLLASMFAYGREHEREADAIGVELMAKAGYDAAEAGRVWKNLLVEIEANPQGRSRNPLFSTHPAPEERQEALAELASKHAGGATHAEAWAKRVQPHLHDWIAEEVKRGQHEESLALFTRLLARGDAPARYSWARGEVYRLRAGEGDHDKALADYLAAAKAGGEPPETHRGLGLIYRARGQAAAARESFRRYLEAAPAAADGAMIGSYLEELGT